MGQRYHHYAGYTSTDRVLSIREVRDSIAEVVDAAERDEPTIITRRGREVAATVPIGLLWDWRRWEEEKVLAVFEARRGSDTVPLAAVAQVLDRR